MNNAPGATVRARQRPKSAISLARGSSALSATQRPRSAVVGFDAASVAQAPRARPPSARRVGQPQAPSAPQCDAQAMAHPEYSWRRIDSDTGADEGGPFGVCGRGVRTVQASISDAHERQVSMQHVPTHPAAAAPFRQQRPRSQSAAPSGVSVVAQLRQGADPSTLRRPFSAGPMYATASTEPPATQPASRPRSARAWFEPPGARRLAADSRRRHCKVASGDGEAVAAERVSAWLRDDSAAQSGTHAPGIASGGRETDMCAPCRNPTYSAADVTPVSAVCKRSAHVCGGGHGTAAAVTQRRLPHRTESHGVTSAPGLSDSARQRAARPASAAPFTARPPTGRARLASRPASAHVGAPQPTLVRTAGSTAEVADDPPKRVQSARAREPLRPRSGRPPSAPPTSCATTSGPRPPSGAAGACPDDYYDVIPEDDSEGGDSASDHGRPQQHAHRSRSPTPRHGSRSPARSCSPPLADPGRHLHAQRPASLVPRTVRLSQHCATAPVYEPGGAPPADGAPLATSADVLAYLVRHGAAASKHLFYLNRRQKRHLLDVVSPFDLVVVSREQRAGNHFAITVSGVSEFWEDREAEFTPLGEWIRLSTACELAVHLPFFVNFTCALCTAALCGSTSVCAAMHSVCGAHSTVHGQCRASGDR